MEQSFEYNEPPERLDHAKVIQWAWSGWEPFGFLRSDDNSINQEVFGLAICQYENDTIFYRFSCDKDWNVVQDSNYENVESAIKYLPEQYQNARINWQIK